jgi:hypothetical protein
VSDLERRLTQLGRELDWPPTPDLSTAVITRLRASAAGATLPPAATRDSAEPPVRRRPRRRLLFPPAGFRRSLAIAVVALLVLAGGVVAAVPSVRHSVLEFFGLRGATVERREHLPPAPRPQLPMVGERTTLAHARDLLGFEPLVPGAAGTPDATFVDGSVPGGRLSLEYRPRPGLPEAKSTKLGLLVDEFRGDLNPDYMGKMAGPTTRIEPFDLDGERAIWVSGAPHFFFYRSPRSAFEERRLRIAQNVLLLEHGRLLIRLEGAFGKARAIELARALRAP